MPTSTRLLPLILTFPEAIASAEPMKIEVRRLPDSSAAATRFLNTEYLVATSASVVSTEMTPLLIFLHGSGGLGSDISKLRTNAPIQYFNQQE